MPSTSGLAGKRGLDPRLCLGRVVQVDLDHLDRATRFGQPVGEATTTVIQGDVADFLIDAERGRDTGFAHALPGADACLVLGLADVGEHPQFGGDVAAGVERDHRDAGVDACLDRIAEGVGVRDRDRHPVRLRGDGGVDQLRHGHHVERVRRPGTRPGRPCPSAAWLTPFCTTDQ